MGGLSVHKLPLSPKQGGGESMGRDGVENRAGKKEAEKEEAVPRRSGFSEA